MTYQSDRYNSPITGWQDRLSENKKVMTVKKNTTKIVVTRVFAGNSVDLFALYAAYVAKRIMFEKGMIDKEALNSSEENSKLPLTLPV